MLAFCTTCWTLISDATRMCPSCGADLEHDSRSFEQKLIAALDHPLPSSRARICWILGQLQPAWAVPLLSKKAEDPDLYVRLEALRALGTIGDESAVPLLQGARKDKSVLIRKEAESALRHIRCGLQPAREK